MQDIGPTFFRLETNPLQNNPIAIATASFEYTTACSPQRIAFAGHLI